jgi:membrane protease YdiL (CAAX protease family)
MKSRLSLSPAALAWGKTIVIVGGALAAYVAVALLVTILTGDAIAGAAASDLIALVLALGYRRRSTGTMRAPAPQPRARTGSFWVAAASALIVCWVAGQAAAIWIYDTFGSEGFDAVNTARDQSPAWLLLVTALILAPIGEESLIRGIAYPALRRHWPPLASAFVTASVFAILHGNLVQIVLTVPLGILLAFVYEATQRLWQVVLMHVLFNVASTVVPAELVQVVAHPAFIACLLLAAALLLYALTPGRYAAEQREDERTHVAP